MTDSTDNHTVQIRRIDPIEQTRQRHLLLKERVATFATYAGNQQDPATLCISLIRDNIKAFHQEDSPLQIVGQIPWELRTWLRDHLHIKQEALTTPLTISSVFELTPLILATTTTPQPFPTEYIDGTWAQESYAENTLLVLHEQRQDRLENIWTKCRATAHNGRLVAVIIQEQPDTRNRRYYSNRQAQTLAFFPTHSIPFGSAIGWKDMPNNSTKRNSHSWDLAEDSIIAPQSTTRVLQRHQLIFNQSPARLE